MRLYFVRHGESEANLLQEFSNSLGKHGLTALGWRQAAALAEKLGGIAFAAIYTSPILRAVQTAEILAERLGAPVQPTDALREYDVGIHEGRADQASWDAYWEVFLAWMDLRDWDRGLEGGETYEDIRARFLPFIMHLRNQYGATDANILLVSHGGTLKCMLPLLLPTRTHAFFKTNHIDNTGYIIVEWRDTGWMEVDDPVRMTE